jgi:hypothetical protein
VRYMMLIYGDETYMDRLSEADRQARMGAWMEYSAALEAAGIARAGEQLQRTATATTVRDDGGKPLVSDGPFAETKEQLAGYIVIDVETREEAIAWAHKCPAAAVGAVELRPFVGEM